MMRKYKVGDVVSYTGKGLVAAITRKVTKGFIVHTGIIIGQDSPLILEMGPRGVEVNRFNMKGKRRRNVYAIHRIKTIKRVEIINRANQVINSRVKYDYRGLLEFVFPFIEDRDKRYYCSELVFDMVKDYLPMSPKKFDDKISPQSLYDLLEKQSERIL